MPLKSSLNIGSKIDHKDGSQLTKCGCDPGLRTVATFVFEEHKNWPNKHIEEFSNNKNKLKEIDPNYKIKKEFINKENKPEIIRRDKNIKKLEITSGYYYENCLLTESKKHMNIDRKIAEIDNIFSSIPDQKTVNVQKYEEHIKYVLKHIKKFQEFAFKSNARKWRFKRDISKKTFYNKLANKLEKTRVGFGNLSGRFANSLKGKKNVPIEDLKNNLIGRNVTLGEVDEFRTSRICHTCLSSDNSKLSILDAYNEQSRPDIFPNQEKILELNQKVTFSTVLCCYQCGSIINRDINAAKNIRDIMDNRPIYFERNYK